MSGGMGECQLTHGELRAWQDNTGIQLLPWEVRAVRQLSLEYLIQSQQSTKPEYPPPFGPISRRAAVAKKIDEIFG